jgi:hypothetical protein
MDAQEPRGATKSQRSKTLHDVRCMHSGFIGQTNMIISTSENQLVVCEVFLDSSKARAAFAKADVMSSV